MLALASKKAKFFCTACVCDLIGSVSPWSLKTAFITHIYIHVYIEYNNITIFFNKLFNGQMDGQTILFVSPTYWQWTLLQVYLDEMTSCIQIG
jgi:hypothetical protein